MLIVPFPQHLYSIHLADQAEDCTLQLADHIKVSGDNSDPCFPPLCPPGSLREGRCPCCPSPVQGWHWDRGMGTRRAGMGMWRPSCLGVGVVSGISQEKNQRPAPPGKKQTKNHLIDSARFPAPENAGVVAGSILEFLGPPPVPVPVLRVPVPVPTVHPECLGLHGGGGVPAAGLPPGRIFLQVGSSSR